MSTLLSRENPPVLPVMNASGRCKEEKDVADLAESAVAAIEAGSFTVLEQAGNPNLPYYRGPTESLNALNIPNKGVAYLRKFGRKMVEIAHAVGKAIFLNVAGKTPKDFTLLVRIAFDCGFDGVVLNTSCPNVIEDGKRYKIFSYYPDLMRQVLDAAFAVRDLPSGFVSVKVSWLEPFLLVDMARCVAEYPIHSVVTMNAFANGLLYGDDGNPLLSTPDKTGWAGVSGRAIKAMALGQVNQWFTYLPSTIGVIGVGGVESGDDVLDMKRAGAWLVQVGTMYYNGGPKVFNDIGTQYINAIPA